MVLKESEYEFTAKCCGRAYFCARELHATCGFVFQNLY